MINQQDSSFLKKLYTDMVRIRTVEETIAEIYHDANEMKCPTHLCTGQEAVAVGVCSALSEKDSISFSHRSHGWYLAKGGDLNAFVAELFGKETGCAGGWGGSMHLIDLEKGVMGSSAILAGTVSHAVGCGLAFDLKGESRVAVAAFGDAAIEEGVFHESMNWAVLKKLPVLFVCENNLYSTQTPLAERQPSVSIYKRAAAYGMPASEVDGNDVLAVNSLVSELIEKMRKGSGPAFIEAKTYRWREHVGPNYDDALGYRSKEEIASWMERCPIKRLENLLEPSECNQIQLEQIEQMNKALFLAREAAFPEVLA